MKTMKLLIVALILFSANILADGLLMPKNKDYPGNFLRNKSTEITVKIRGMIAETIVRNEFVNDWTNPVSAVYSFPLPLDARSSMLLYTRNDTTFKAKLRIEPQDPNPGTGEGGIAAEVNKYIGKNGIKFSLENIKPGYVQVVELHYISLLKFENGNFTYSFPLNTSKFITNSIDNLKITFDLKSNNKITNYQLASHPNLVTLLSEDNHKIARMLQPKAFLTSDISFTFNTELDHPDLEFYSVKNDTMASHFAMLLKSGVQDDSLNLSKQNIYLLDDGFTMGLNLNVAKETIKGSLSKLSNRDKFNIVLFSNGQWQANAVNATIENKDLAIAWLNNLSAPNYMVSNFTTLLNNILIKYDNVQYANNLFMFSNQTPYINPIALVNSYKVHIYPLLFTDQYIDKYNLNLLAKNNYGFATFCNINDDIPVVLSRILNMVNKPVFMNTSVEYNKPDVFAVEPEKLSVFLSGGYQLVTGRYETGGTTNIVLKGEDRTGLKTYTFPVEFSNSSLDERFPELIYGKLKIENLENYIEARGETSALKDSLINLSLMYGIRCKYTSYFADYKDVYASSTDNIQEVVIPQSFIVGNYPNPFNPSTNIKFYLDNKSIGKQLYIKIYNLLGQLVKVIDISNLGEGWHTVQFRADNLPSGIYVACLEMDNVNRSTIKLVLLK